MNGINNNANILDAGTAIGDYPKFLTEKCDMEPGMVIEVLRKGYLLKDKVLRPAMVKVSE